MKNGTRNEESFCVKCGTCNTVCPVYLATGNEIHTPRGKQHLKSKIAKGEVSSHYAEIFSQCLLCGACLEACPRGLDTPELVTSVRAELPRLSGLSFLKFVSRKALVHPSLLSGLTRVGSAAGTLLGEWLPQDSGLRLRLQGFGQHPFKLPAKGYIDKVKAKSGNDNEQQESRQEQNISFFTGCLANYLQPEIAEATQLLVAKTTGRKAVVPLAQTCCGMAAMAAGRPDETLDLAKRNISAFEDNELPILTSCSSCYFQLKTYKELFADDPEWAERAAGFTKRLEEFSSFFLKKFSAGSKKITGFNKSSDLKVFYHDPCHLRFKLHITEEPRQLLKLFPAIDLQELPGGPQCCGQGGLFQVAHPHLALQVWENLMGNYGALLANTVVTACSGCLLQWQRGLGAGESDSQVKHLAVFIARLIQ
jgi:glycolate oxidase iron-sulfur subunit